MGTNSSNLKSNFYNEFVDYLSNYISKTTFIKSRTNHQLSLHDEICHIISLYCDPQLILLYDFNGYNNINQTDTITSIAMEYYGKTQKLYKNKTNSIWITFNNQIINYCYHTNTVSKPIPNIVSFHLVDKINYPQTTENKTISNVKSCFVLIRSYCHHIFIANNGYSNYKTLIGAPANFIHWKGFIVPFRGRIGPPDEQFHNESQYGIDFIITEICNLLWTISICSITTVSIGTYPRNRIKYAILYEPKKKNKRNIYEYKELYSNINITKQKYNKKNGVYDESYCPWYILDIQTIFDYKKHILFMYDAHVWVLYIPLNIFVDSKCINLCNKNENKMNFKNTKLIDVDIKKHLYKKNDDYIIFCGKTYLEDKEFAKFKNGIMNDWIYRKYFDGFKSVINDTENKRFIVSNNTQLNYFRHKDLNLIETDECYENMNVKSTQKQINVDNLVECKYEDDDISIKNETIMGYEQNNNLVSFNNENVDNKNESEIDENKMEYSTEGVTLMGATMDSIEDVDGRNIDNVVNDNSNVTSQKTDQGVCLIGYTGV